MDNEVFLCGNERHRRFGDVSDERLLPTESLEHRRSAQMEDCRMTTRKTVSEVKISFCVRRNEFWHYSQF